MLWQPFLNSPFTRTVFFLCVLLVALVGPWWIGVLLGLGYILVYRGLEIVFIAFLVDAYFGYLHPHPYLYTLGTTVSLLAVVAAEKFITVYNTDTYVS